MAERGESQHRRSEQHQRRRFRHGGTATTLVVGRSHDRVRRDGLAHKLKAEIFGLESGLKEDVAGSAAAHIGAGQRKRQRRIGLDRDEIVGSRTELHRGVPEIHAGSTVAGHHSHRVGQGRRDRKIAIQIQPGRDEQIRAMEGVAARAGDRLGNRDPGSRVAGVSGDDRAIGRR